MAHYAKVLDGKVIKVIKAEPEFFNKFVDSSAGEWIRTSYNTHGGIHYDQEGNPSSDQSKALRKNYAGMGYQYDKERDAFIPPQPFPSWTLDEATCRWEAPTPMPSDDKTYNWDEDAQNWMEIVEVEPPPSNI
jgi:hypothetical protein